MFFTREDKAITWPLLITDIPYSHSGLQSRRIRFNFYAPSISETFKIKLHVMSDTYIGVDWETEMILKVVARKERLALKYSLGDDSEYGMDRITKALMDKVLLQLPVIASEDEMESKVEAIVAQFLESQKKKKSAGSQKALLKIQDKSKSRDGKCEESIKVEMKQCQSEHTGSDHSKSSSEDDGLSRQKESGEEEIEQSQSNDIKAHVKRQAYLLWQSVYGRKPILCNDLEKVIPDILITSKKWFEMDSCDPKKDYMSEWNMKWDCKDVNDENWHEEKSKCELEFDRQEFDQERFYETKS